MAADTSQHFSGDYETTSGCFAGMAWIPVPEKGGRLSSLSAVTGILSITVLAIWGISMYCLTSVTAENATARYKTDFGGFASTFSSHSFEEQRTELLQNIKTMGSTNCGKRWIWAVSPASPMLQQSKQ